MKIPATLWLYSDIYFEKMIKPQCILKFEDDGSILHLCDLPHKCQDCTALLHRVKPVLIEDWYSENLLYINSLCINLEADLLPNLSELLEIKGLISLMESIQITLTEEQKKWFHKKTFLIENRVRYSETTDKLTISLKIYIPPIKESTESNFSLKDQISGVLTQYKISETILRPEYFEPQNFRPILYNPEKMEDLLGIIQQKIGPLKNVTETIFLLTWGVFNYDYTSNMGFKCKILNINKLNQNNMKIYVPK